MTLRDYATREAFENDIPAEHALDRIRHLEGSSGPWKHPVRKVERFPSMLFVLTLWALVAALVMAALAAWVLA